ncbi:R3H domain-containing protein 2-like [Canna indica]|uniref:R3H domain-containing protein 2-like n=1 Tax=Canna indica TaxID=4628 RepID=A0AAQ3K7E0_9LILI|nr:R3H domain-containing protein 2-like [Canna indica]
MEGFPADGPAAVPDSWEMADLDAGISRLLVSSRRSSSRHDPAEGETVPPHETGAPGPSCERRGGVSEDVLSQVDQFLLEALEKPRERLAILRMEQDVEKFIQDPTQQHLEFEGLPTSYLRLAAHRVAQHYSLQSVAIPDNSFPDGSGSRIVLQKINFNCKLPAVRLADIPVNSPQEDRYSTVKLAIKQRPQKHLQNFSNVNSHTSKSLYNKSVEERKEEYNRARERIFSTNNSISCSSTTKPKKLDTDLKSQDRGRCNYFASARSDEISAADEHGSNLRRSFSDSSTSGIRSNRNNMEKDPPISRQKICKRVAIFRDHEVDRKDPDYDRNYERYMQRYDPGFGYNGGPYTVQPLYSSAVNYNSEFPQLGSGQRVQIPVEHQRPPISQHFQGHWSAASASTLPNYARPESMLVSFNPSTVGDQSSSSVYLHSSQYRPPVMPFVHPPEHIPSSGQGHRQQTEVSFALARSR